MVNSKEFLTRISKIGIRKRWEKEHSKVRVNNKLSKEKVAINSYLCGDGWIKIRKERKRKNAIHYEIRIYPDSSYLAKRIVDLFKKEYNIKPKIRVLKNYFNVEIKNKPVCLNLMRFGNYNSQNWGIPKNLSKRLLKEWIKCFFDCESNVDIKGKKIALKSINFNGLSNIKDKLKIFGIESCVYGPYNPKNSKHSSYGVLVINKNNIKLYKKLINFYHPSKKEKIKLL